MRQSQSLDQQVGELFEEPRARPLSSKRLLRDLLREFSRAEKRSERERRWDSPKDDATKDYRPLYKKAAAEYLAYVGADPKLEALVQEEFVAPYAKLQAYYDAEPGRKREHWKKFRGDNGWYAFTAFAGGFLGGMVGLIAGISQVSEGNLGLLPMLGAFAGYEAFCWGWPYPLEALSKAAIPLRRSADVRALVRDATLSLDRKV